MSADAILKDWLNRELESVGKVWADIIEQQLGEVPNAKMTVRSGSGMFYELSLKAKPKPKQPSKGGQTNCEICWGAIEFDPLNGEQSDVGMMKWNKDRWQVACRKCCTEHAYDAAVIADMIEENK
jgi:hypothetical protein